MRRATNALLVLTPFLLVACEADVGGDTEAARDVAAAADTAAPRDFAADEADIGEVRDAWVRGAEAGDAATVASLYAEDAVMVAPDGRVAEGREAIRDALRLEGITSLEINSTDTQTGSDVASDMGTYTQTLQSAEGQEQTVNGRYLVVLRRQSDGNWKIVQHLSTGPAGEEQGAGR